ncbi:Metallo-dependent phosphatase-like protein [Clohesyomyces aquaticus]|uniref:Metallo-dependent phosphatase-like protein n=1 Tax=Clohesyomyces aquaticus TaxID=1231657 RepID=A0A1Y1ZXB6_9PLEO|nr:Metallo-dependent phosphatase-like protein [Clohesyomyces aquaticus]
MNDHTSRPLLRRTRIVCISDTHNQTPKLPKGDVLIHAGDLTNQGSYTELKKTVEWLEKAEFEAKIVIAGNHDITLEPEFYKEHGTSWRWPKPQEPTKCRSLFLNSPSITYLEHEAASIFLSSPTGPRTCFKVFGSPYHPNLRNWPFKYAPGEGGPYWKAIPLDTDIVITHGPPENHLDVAGSKPAGCEALLKALHRVRPMLSIFGHIHEARGAERVQWDIESANGCLEMGTETWEDPGAGSNKQSLVNLTAKGGRPLRTATLTRQSSMNFCSLASSSPMGDTGAQPDVLQPGVSNSTSPDVFPAVDNEANGMVKKKLGGAFELRQASDIGWASEPDVEADERRSLRNETCMINAAFLGPHFSGPKQFRKPIVVDVDLPVWC